MKAGTRSVLSVLLAGLAATACSDKGQAAAAPPTAPNTDQIELALIVSLSGADQGVGAEAQRGALTAISQVNALGGVLGKQLTLRIVDDQSDPNVTAAKMTDLADKDKVVFGIGPSTSRTAKRILPLIKSDKVLYITPSATSKELDCLEVGATQAETDALCAAAKASAALPNARQSPVLFKTAASDSILATAIAQYASETDPTNAVRRCRSVAILKQTDSYGLPIADALEKRIRLLSLAVPKNLDLSPTVDSSAILDDAASQVGKSGADCQAVIAQPAVAGAYMRSFKKWATQNPPAAGKAPIITIGSDGFRQDQFIVEGRVQQNDANSPTAGEGSFAIAADTQPDTPEYASFAALFSSVYPTTAPGRYSSTAYDAVILLAGAFERAKGNTSVADVRAALIAISQGRRTIGSSKMSEFLQAARDGEDINYEGASGSVDFIKETGGVRNPFGVWEIKQARFELKKQFDPSEISGL